MTRRLNPGHLSQAEVLRLQQTAGNQAVLRLRRSSKVGDKKEPSKAASEIEEERGLHAADAAEKPATVCEKAAAEAPHWMQRRWVRWFVLIVFLLALGIGLIISAFR
jgi:hypothetical protein